MNKTVLSLIVAVVVVVLGVVWYNHGTGESTAPAESAPAATTEPAAPADSAAPATTESTTTTQ